MSGLRAELRPSSELGKGSVFTLTLPLIEVEPSAKDFSILVVEDTPANVAFFRRILSQLGRTADCAMDGAPAIDRFVTRAYDLVFCDMLLPDMSGEEVV